MLCHSPYLRVYNESHLSLLSGAVGVAKRLEHRSSNLEVPSSNPPGARAFFSSSINGRVCPTGTNEGVKLVNNFLYQQVAMMIQNNS